MLYSREGSYLMWCEVPSIILGGGSGKGIDQGISC